MLKVKMNFSLQNLRNSAHTCPLYFKLMPTTTLSHILHHEERIENAFEKITTEKKIALKLFR